MAAPRRQTPTELITAPAREGVVKARDAAILEALKVRPWPESGLLTVLPAEANETVETRQAALHSALIRMRVKEQIELVDGLWRLKRAA